MVYPAGQLDTMRSQIGIDEQLHDLQALDAVLAGFGIADWCEYDLGIVRGLAYYTGTVFEIHEATGAERAMAGGGRYDGLVELFGGPPTPAVGMGMGDVVLMNVLADKRLLPEDAGPRPDAFLIAATDDAAQRLIHQAAALRRYGLHTRFSYKNTRNLGKLLKDAAAANARYAVILDDQAQQGQAAVKDLATGEQSQIALADLPTHLSPKQTR